MFAAYDLHDNYRQAHYFAEQAGGFREDWKHSKGIVMVRDKYGNEFEADVHYVENPKIGQLKFTVIRPTEAIMEPERRYWE